MRFKPILDLDLHLLEVVNPVETAAVASSNFDEVGPYVKGSQFVRYCDPQLSFNCPGNRALVLPRSASPSLGTTTFTSMSYA